MGNCGKASISLDHIIKQKAVLSEGTIRAIAKQLLEGLRLIHSCHVIHRNIKCENILLHCPPGSDRVIVKISDFGFVKFEERNKQAMIMSSKGTTLNMAPELVIGDGKGDARVDVWCAGIVLFQLVAHNHPINAVNFPELTKFFKQKKIIRPASIRDNQLWDLLMQLLAFDRTKRLTAAEALQHPYFTGPQALKEISAEAHQITAQSLDAQKKGDTSITSYDIDVTYTVSGIEIKKALNYNPEIDLQQINQKLNPQIQSNNKKPVLPIRPPPPIPTNKRFAQQLFEQEYNVCSSGFVPKDDQRLQLSAFLISIPETVYVTSISYDVMLVSPLFQASNDQA
ncbi:MAG: hypothetical protein EZS28_032396, partial [Streblomastix strix]